MQSVCLSVQFCDLLRFSLPLLNICRHRCDCLLLFYFVLDSQTEGVWVFLRHAFEKIWKGRIAYLEMDQYFFLGGGVGGKEIKWAEETKCQVCLGLWDCSTGEKHIGHIECPGWEWGDIPTGTVPGFSVLLAKKVFETGVLRNVTNIPPTHPQKIPRKKQTCPCVRLSGTLLQKSLSLTPD